jgi:hypothetical protein
VADIMRGVVDGIDTGKTNNTDEEQSESHGQDCLENDAEVLAGNWQINGVGLLHVGSPWN